MEVHFEHAASGQDAALQRFFGTRVRFGQMRNCLIVDQREADRQHRTEDREFINILNQHMASDNNDLSATERVRALVSVRLGLAPVELEHLAAELGMTARTLQLRLSAEGTSHRDIVRSYREQMAMAYLAQGSLSLEEVSAALGYAEATVFSRAFKDSTGRSPGRRSPRP